MDSARNDLAALRELSSLQSDDADKYMQLSESLRNQGHDIGAIFAAREAYKHYSTKSPEKAEELLYQFGHEITPENNQPAITGNYLRLSRYFGTISTYLRKVKLPKGSTLFHQGDKADFIYLLTEGELTVHATHHGQFKLLNYLREGSLVGEAALHDEDVRSASVIAHTDSTLLRLTPQELSHLLKKSTRLSIQFAKESMLRRHVTLISSTPLFGKLSLDLRYMVAKRTWNLSYGPEEVIKHPDEYMHHAALIIEGSVRVLDGDTCLKVLQKGQMLGTRKLAGLMPSPLTFVAESRCKTICMPFAVAQDIMELTPEFADEIRNTIEIP